jgi:hypothetical protein
MATDAEGTLTSRPVVRDVFRDQNHGRTNKDEATRKRASHGEIDKERQDHHRGKLGLDSLPASAATSANTRPVPKVWPPSDDGAILSK